jgi:hypothetical protein
MFLSVFKGKFYSEEFANRPAIGRTDKALKAFLKDFFV